MDLDRFTANIALLERLEKYLLENRDIRFSQALRNLGLVKEIIERDDRSEITRIYWKGEFNLEPQELLKRVQGVENGVGTS